jgi:hypothetical protein
MRNLSGTGWTVARPLAGAALAIGILVAAVGAVPLNGFMGAPAAAPAAISGDATNNFASQATGGSTQQPLGAAPQTPADRVTDTGADKGASPEAASASGNPAPVAGAGTPSSFPGAQLGSETPDTETTGPAVATESTTPPPPNAAESPHMQPAPSPTQAYIAAAPSAQPPTAQPQAPVAGSDVVAVTPESSLDRNALVIGGLVLALIALLALGVISFARRRYSDPLVR